MTDPAVRQQEILEAIVAPSLPYRSKEQQEKDLLRLELDEDLRETSLHQQAEAMEHCGGKNVIFSATGFYCTECKCRV